MTKMCNKCQEEKPLTEFYNCKGSKDGTRNMCKYCDQKRSKLYKENNKDSISKTNKLYREKNKEKAKANRKVYDENNKEKIAKSTKAYKEKNKKHIRECEKAYYKNNREKINKRRKTYRENNKEKIRQHSKNSQKNYKSTPIGKLKCSIRALIAYTFKSKDFAKKGRRTQNILGCTYDEFLLYLESKFEPWMTWKNKGLYNGTLNYGWDIDHIIPISSAQTEEEVIKLNHYTNLQPLCSYTNRVIKRDNIY